MGQKELRRLFGLPVHAGPLAGFDGNLRYYLSMIRLFCAEIGIT